MNVYMVSVVRDYEMYGHCVLDNPYCRDFRKIPIDNLKENLPVSVRYNAFLDSFDGDGWIVFCHEDWELLAPLEPILEKLDRKRLYGPIGAMIKEERKADFIYLCGSVSQSDKNGKHRSKVKGIYPEGEVGTFDCQCLIVHSSLVREKGLRFDPNLRFDMYVEDFCAAARESHGIESYALDLPCNHYSKGVIGPGFLGALEYVQGKYAGAKARYSTTVGRRNTFGKNYTKPVFNLRRVLTTKIRYYVIKSL